MTINSSGFLVVRSPEKNRDVQKRGAFSAEAPHLGPVYYSGIDRMPWFDIEEDFYKGGLPDDLVPLLRRITSSSDFSGINLCTDLTIARDLLNYSNRRTVDNELIVVRAKKLAALKGIVEIDETQIRWIGYDLVCLGGASLLRDGVFSVPTAFPGWQGSLNQDGLLPSSSVTAAYLQAYKTAMAEGVVEELPEELPNFVYAVDAIEIGRVT